MKVFTPSSFVDCFERATLARPYPYQRELAEGEVFPDLLHVPTGAGKTAAAILGWLWRRRFSPEQMRRTTPRRLVYCLPMRVLVEQTRDCAIHWLQRLNLLAGEASFDDRGRVLHYEPGRGEDERIAVTVLMGGEDRDAWDIHPEREAVIVGTQDMLLSRALNRGYAASRYRWPLHFGLVSNDALWVADEPQLMGNGLATTSQLAAFRRSFGTFGPGHTLWMSATLKPEWLATADFDPSQSALRQLGLSENDLKDDRLKKRHEAKKRLARASAARGLNARGIVDLAQEIVRSHRGATKTLAVINTVRRAAELHLALEREFKKAKLNPKLVLVHSRFRPGDREAALAHALADPPLSGTIVVSTQVIEAGVDVSARLLYTELAPWASLVQRFGRCNRLGDDEDAEVRWIDLDLEKQALPYASNELASAREELTKLTDAGPAWLPDLPMPYATGHVLRKKDVIELFDTTPDLAGNDIDVSRFIREADAHDVHVFWRDIPPGESPLPEAPEPAREELCPAPIGDIRSALEKGNLEAWMYDPLDEVWVQLDRRRALFPGMTLLLRATDGRYTTTAGWNPSSRNRVAVVMAGDRRASGYSSDPFSLHRRYETIVEHTDHVVATAEIISDAVGLEEPWRGLFLRAARWHDAGKAHEIFQRSMRDGGPPGAPTDLLAKTAKKTVRHGRPHFRHEMASAILALLHDESDLVAYLVAAHHGKVRLSLRSLPGERLPPESRLRFARGVWDDDPITQVDLGGGVIVPATRIDLSYMDLGDGPRGSSWIARIVALRDRQDLGPFRLAYLEALIKSADERASAAETTNSGGAS